MNDHGVQNIQSDKSTFLFLHSRTLTSVHDNILDDLCFPAEIVGKRIRIKLDGSRLIKVHLDKGQQTNIEHKVNITTSEASFLKINESTK